MIQQTVLYSLIQGLTEYLPVSSSGHLALAASLLGDSVARLDLIIAVHIGTLLATLIYYRATWTKELSTFFSGRLTQQGKHLLIATLPALLLGYFLVDAFNIIAGEPRLVAVGIAVLGVILWIVDSKASQKKKMRAMTTGDAFLIGCAQMFALLPGISRSGATIAMARARGIEREAATTFSFLLAAPITAAAAGYFLFNVRSVDVLQMLLAILLSAALALVVIRFMLFYVRRHSLVVFALYSFILAVLVWFF